MTGSRRLCVLLSVPLSTPVGLFGRPLSAVINDIMYCPIDIGGFLAAVIAVWPRQVLAVYLSFVFLLCCCLKAGVSTITWRELFRIFVPRPTCFSVNVWDVFYFSTTSGSRNSHAILKSCSDFVLCHDSQHIITQLYQRQCITDFALLLYICRNIAVFRDSALPYPSVTCLPGPSLLQPVATDSNDCTSVAVIPDGAALLVGWTDDDFLEGTTNYYTDFAGVVIGTGGTSSTGSTTFTPAPGASPGLTLAPFEATPTPPGPTPSPFEAPSTPPKTPAPESSPQQPSAATPQPVVSSPSSCGATESFQITSGGLPEIEGCLQATDASFSNLGSNLEVWTVSGDTSYDQVAVIGYSADGNEQMDTPYNVTYITNDDDATTVYCYSSENAITVHPSDATWQCDLGGTGTFVEVSDGSTSFDCGCNLTPESTPSSPVPLAPVIGGTVGGLAFLAVVVVMLAKFWSKKDRGVGENATVATTYPTLPENATVATAYPAPSIGGNHGLNAPRPAHP
ncbi:unnamed protein product [Pylaiella littoralis]